MDNKEKQKSWTSRQSENDYNAPDQNKKQKKFNNNQPQLMRKENAQQTLNKQSTNSKLHTWSLDVIFPPLYRALFYQALCHKTPYVPTGLYGTR